MSDVSAGYSTRRSFVKGTVTLAGAALCDPKSLFASTGGIPEADEPADYTLTIASTPLEIAPNRIISATVYNGQFPGPLLRFQEGRREFVANNPGATLFHCHQQLHMDYGFMTLFEYV
jgi:FtsP/CotA-like multicopper oxidase with cupredoxin domain